MRFKEAVEALAVRGIESARHDAAEIFTRLGGYNPALLSIDNSECDNETVISAVQRRAQREPLQYIIGEVGFYKETYKVSPDCLIPRADTEILVDYVVSNLPDGERVLDLCTGSGCVGISTVKNTKNTTAIAVDISSGALLLARENAKINGVLDRISFLEHDVLSECVEGDFFAILSNPPYVSESEYAALEPEIYFEPKEAFLGGESGLIFYEKITELYKDKLKSGGFIAYEIGCTQADALTKIAKENGMRAEIIKDLSGLDRVAILRKV